MKYTAVRGLPAACQRLRCLRRDVMAIGRRTGSDLQCPACAPHVGVPARLLSGMPPVLPQSVKTISASPAFSLSRETSKPWHRRKYTSYDMALLSRSPHTALTAIRECGKAGA